MSIIAFIAPVFFIVTSRLQFYERQIANDLRHAPVNRPARRIVEKQAGSAGGGWKLAQRFSAEGERGGGEKRRRGLWQRADLIERKGNGREDRKTHALRPDTAISATIESRSLAGKYRA